MKKMIKNPHSFAIILALLILIGSVVPSQVSAQGIVQGGDLPAGQTIQGDAIFHGNSVQINGDIVGDVFAIANDVEISGKISGSLVVLGNKVKVNSSVGGTVYAAAVLFKLGPEADLSRNLYFAGLSLNTQGGAQIRRDLFSATMGAQLKGLVDGDIRAIIGAAEFLRYFMQKIGPKDWFSSNETALSDSAHSQLAVFNEPEVLQAGFLPDLAWKAASFEHIGAISWDKVTEWLLNRLQEWFVLLAFGLAGLWLMPKWISGSAQLLRSRPLPAAGWGLLGVVLSFNLVGVAVLLLIIILAIGIFMGMISFWQLAWSFMAIAGFSLGLSATIFSLFVLYISKAIVAFLVGSLILRRTAPGYADYKALALITGLVLYVFVRAIPVLGWVIGILATVLGLGCAWLFYRDQRGLKKSLSNY